LFCKALPLDFKIARRQPSAHREMGKQSCESSRSNMQSDLCETACTQTGGGRGAGRPGGQRAAGQAGKRTAGRVNKARRAAEHAANNTNCQA